MKQYIVDAFTDSLFHGNQAAVCVLDKPLPEELMLAITRENNFSETAFVVLQENGYYLRWFTPGGEVDLCGHATLATAFVLFSLYPVEGDSITFSTLGGEVTVRRIDGDMLEMESPANELQQVPVTPILAAALGTRPDEAYLGRDLLCVFRDEDTVRNLSPNFKKVKALNGLLLHVTAPGKDCDCVSRSFAPKLDVPEDPVCGSGHCHIIPYWAERLGKSEFTASQVSARGGTLYCRIEGEKVYLAGRAVLFSVCDIKIEP